MGANIKEVEFNGVKYCLIKPSLGVVRESKIKYNKSFTDALKQGFQTRKKIELLLRDDKDVDIITDYQTRTSELQQAYKDTLEKAALSIDPDELELYASLLFMYKESATREDNSISALFSVSADQFAEDERVSFLVYSLTRKEDKPVWVKFDDFLLEEDLDLVETLKYTFLAWERKIEDMDFSNKTEREILERADQLRAAQKPKEPEAEIAVMAASEEILGKAKKKKQKKAVEPAPETELKPVEATDA